MAGSNENNPNLIAQANNDVKPVGLPAGGGKILAPIGNNRRALRDINRNIIEAPSYPWAVNKRPFPERDATSAGNPPTQAHRPVTRRLASQMANMKQSTVEEVLSSYGSVPTSSETEDMNSDNPVPMYVQHTEAMLEEIDRMDEEVEMEDIDEEEPIIDIDRGDKNNPLAVIEYIDELYAYYQRTEASSCVPVNYMDSQCDINQKMRGILIDWLIEVHYKFDLMDETLYLTVNVIDRFLALRPVIRRKLQLVGVTAMLLACKYEEVSVPVVDDLILISDRAYTREELLQMESLIVNTLQFNLSVPTPYVFMRRFLKAAQIDPTLESVAYFIIELCLVEYEMLAFPPSLLAAAAVYTAQCTISRMRYWSKTSEWHTKYTEEQLMECAKMMVTFHQNSGIGKLTGVHRKYNTAKYGYAAKTLLAKWGRIVKEGCPSSN